MRTDARGLAITTSSDAAVAAFDDVLVCYLEYRQRIGKALKALLAADPECVLSQVLVGYLMMSRGTLEGVADAKRALETAQNLAGEHLTARERMHVAALDAWVTGSGFRACRIWEEILTEYPQDLLALRLAHFQSFWLGTHRRMRNVVLRALPAWDASMPRYGDVLGMAAFGHEEMGDYATAERLGRRAVELNPEDMWSLHAVAHVLEMQGRDEEGLAWLGQPLDRWDDRAALRTHLWWHKTLFHFERGEYAPILDLYDEAVDPGPDMFYIDMQNCASLLARLDLMGVDVGERWEVLAGRAVGWVDNHLMCFTDVHTIMPLARTGSAHAAAHLGSLEAFARTDNDNAERVRNWVLPVCRGIDAFYSGDYARTIDLLLPLKDDMQPIGGSNAQRDVFHLFLLEAALKAERFALARSLAAERMVLRSHSHESLLKYEQALAGLGEPRPAASLAATH